MDRTYSAFVQWQPVNVRCVEICAPDLREKGVSIRGLPIRMVTSWQILILE